MVEFTISKQSQKELLSLARKAIAQYLKSYESADFSVDDNSELTQPAAVFVTLTKHGQLRGCVGTTEAQYPLCEAVIRMALSAALNDTRFPRLTLKELPEIKIEISALSPMRKVKDACEIIQNKHGVLIQKEAESGLFLPQVWEHFDNKEDFLNELCSQKAGLPRESWKEPSTDIFVFTVFSFEE
jgi:uncharacterized protein, PH0010 family